MSLQRCFADLHIHVGHSKYSGPVKITASRKLTLPAILEECTERKGIDMAAVVDCVTEGVQRELRELREEEQLVPVDGGGYLYRNELVLIPAAEVEAVEEHGGASHWLGYFPSIETLADFAAYLADTVTNMSLSSQRSFRTAQDVVRAIDNCGGFPVPAHAFTPFRSVYGSAASSLGELLGTEEKKVKFLELGLSADTGLADRLPGNHRLAYLSNSDAHSTQKIGREHNELLVAEPSCQELIMALQQRQGRTVVANYGLDPRLGKYHRTYCRDCEHAAEEPPPVCSCACCGSERVVMGVLDRVVQLTQAAGTDGEDLQPPERPEYRYQVPLDFIPGIGPKTITKLIGEFGSELKVLHEAPQSLLESVVGVKLARRIAAARSGSLDISAGGGGSYGKVQK